MYEFENDKDEQIQQQSTKNWPENLVRAIGIILLLVGLWAGIQVLLEALGLYRDPVKIEQLSSAIERGSNLDKNLVQRSPDDTGENGGAKNPSTLNDHTSGQNLHLSYFAAWIIALLLLMLVAMIAFSSIRTGSELVLQDKQMKRYIRLLAKELGARGSPGK